MSVLLQNCAIISAEIRSHLRVTAGRKQNKQNKYQVPSQNFQATTSSCGGCMRVVIADLKGRGGFVNKDTVVGGYGSRFRGFSWTTRWIERARKLYENVPSIHAGYLAAIFTQSGHRVRITRYRVLEGD